MEIIRAATTKKELPRPNDSSGLPFPLGRWSPKHWMNYLTNLTKLTAVINPLPPGRKWHGKKQSVHKIKFQGLTTTHTYLPPGSLWSSGIIT